MAAFDLPRPQIGDAMERLSLDGQIEESMVISIKYHKSQSSFWNAVLVTRNGFEFVSCHAEHRGEHDWRPKGWEYDRRSNTFVPVGTIWDKDKKNLILPESFLTESATPDMTLPSPMMGEKYMSWRARAYKAVPGLKDNPRAPEALSSAWKNREQLSH